MLTYAERKRVGLSSGIFSLTRWCSLQVFTAVLRSAFGLQVLHAGRLQPGRQYLWAPNHSSHLDFWAVLAALPKAAVQRTLIGAAQDRFYAKPWNHLLTALFSYHNFPFDRRGLALESYRRIKQVVARGYSLLLFAQGARTRDGRLLPFKPILAMLALESGIPLVPVAVAGTFEALPAGAGWPKRQKLVVAFGEPLDPRFYLEQSKTNFHAAIHGLNMALATSIQELWAEAQTSRKSPA